MNFEGRVALITGGTAGIGEAAVPRVASLAARTVFVGRDENDGGRIEYELLRVSADAVVFQADLSRPDEVQRIFPATINIYGRSTTRSTLPEYLARTESSPTRPRRTAVMTYGRSR
jgi:NAD(P)-dependent dehydrogenase (short-subunit alcohol dehydrogenase family)